MPITSTHSCQLQGNYDGLIDFQLLAIVVDITLPRKLHIRIARLALYAGITL